MAVPHRGSSGEDGQRLVRTRRSSRRGDYPGARGEPAPGAPSGMDFSYRGDGERMQYSCSRTLAPPVQAAVDKATPPRSVWNSLNYHPFSLNSTLNYYPSAVQHDSAWRKPAPGKLGPASKLGLERKPFFARTANLLLPLPCTHDDSLKKRNHPTPRHVAHLHEGRATPKSQTRALLFPNRYAALAGLSELSGIWEAHSALRAHGIPAYPLTTEHSLSAQMSDVMVDTDQTEIRPRQITHELALDLTDGACPGAVCI
ncbi:hypothetical protein SKAU_G00311770 [Synaphobranchus kaupii]|uniref:Uncharacterized protein n=1 Tax=Synaphobranchus kaupii TaxID=118154 RepID=A0A9Q1ES02_SYNKA|nr:hypothetical protein SKAU_G00311770 [Synaphobranchus kaupii]